MSLSMVVQAFGWVAVLWLITVHLLIHQGRLHRGGAAPRVAGTVAALVIVVASLLSEMWPVFVLGLLWLRSELWHRHSPDEAWFPLPDEPPNLDLPEAEVTHAATNGSPPPDATPDPAPDPRPRRHPDAHPDRHPVSPASGGGTTTKPRTSVPAQSRAQARARVRARAMARTHPEGRTEPGAKPHHRHPLISRHAVDVLFRIEMTLLIAVTVAAFAFWAYQERPGFSQRANNSVCTLMGGCPGH